MVLFRTVITRTTMLHYTEAQFAWRSPPCDIFAKRDIIVLDQFGIGSALDIYHFLTAREPVGHGVSSRHNFLSQCARTPLHFFENVYLHQGRAAIKPARETIMSVQTTTNMYWYTVRYLQDITLVALLTPAQQTVTHFHQHAPNLPNHHRRASGPDRRHPITNLPPIRH